MEKHTKNNEAYTNKTKSKEMKVELAAVFLDIIRRKFAFTRQYWG